MRLPHQFIENIAFVTNDANDLVAALGDACSSDEVAEIQRLCGIGLPPVTSQNALAAMTGYNPGFIWSLVHRAHRHYRIFPIPKGSGERQIEAPKVALKAIQKWLSVHFERQWTPRETVHGFVKGRSHITAAKVHLGAEWIVSADIANFFPSTSAVDVRSALVRLGYQSSGSLDVLTSLLCFFGRLSQGAPSSPVVSNIALDWLDARLSAYAEELGLRYTRYADDIVISGKADQLVAAGGPDAVIETLKTMFANTSWTLSERKFSFDHHPKRLKVHGLLIHGKAVRLTKGYRNRIRAFKHLIANDKILGEDARRIFGHLNYARQIDEASNS